MIIEVIFDVIVTLLLAIIGLFPTIPVIKTDGLDTIFELLGAADMFISLKTVSACLVAILVIKNSSLVWSVIMWVVRKIPSIN